MRTFPLRWALVALACSGSAALAGCDLFYDFADPSVAAADRPADQADAVPDQSPTDGSDVAPPDDRADAPDAPDAFDGSPPLDARPDDVASDDGVLVDQDDASADLTDESDAAIPDVLPDAAEAGDALSMEVAVDVPPDRFDDAFADHTDVADADAPADEVLDVPDALADVPADASDGDVGSADTADTSSDASDAADVPDAAPVPGLVVTYRSTNGPYTIPSGGRVGQVLISFGARRNVTCTPVAEPDSVYRCVIPAASLPAGVTDATGLYLAIPNACGIDIGTTCEGWNDMWAVNWQGIAYDASSRRTVDGGTEPAFGLLSDRETCFAQMGYYNYCVRLRF